MSNTLYERLGGNGGIGAIVDTAVELHLANPLVGTRFRKSDPAALKRLAHAFFCAGSGGPEAYDGRDMRTAHEGMNINEQEYFAVMDDIVKAMHRHGVGPAERAEVIAILYSLKDEILRV